MEATAFICTADGGTSAKTAKANHVQGPMAAEAITFVSTTLTAEDTPATASRSRVTEDTPVTTAEEMPVTKRPRWSEEDDVDGWSDVDGGSEEDEDNNAIASGPSEEISDQSPAVNSGYEGRARRGVSKAGGYDETPKRRGPRKRTGVRIRYVDDDERGGGTTEQGIRMGPVSVWRVVHGHRSEASEGCGTPATPLRDPG